MLIQFKVQNFKSFKDDQTFSLVASADKTEWREHVFEPAQHESPLLQSAAIYGPNGSGKTTFVDALLALKSLVLTSAETRQKDEKLTKVVPFKLEPESLNQPTSFEIIFRHQDIKYQYGLTLTPTQVITEYLYAFPEARAQLWFERTHEEDGSDRWYFGPKLKGSKKPIQDATQNNTLCLSTAALLDHEQLKAPFEWFKNDLHIMKSHHFDFWFTAVVCQNPDRLKKIVAFMNQIDLSISGLAFEQTTPADFNLPAYVPEKFRDLIFQQIEKGELGKPVFVHTSKATGTEYRLKFEEMSLGSQRAFCLAGFIIGVLENGWVLVVDELHNNFHPFLTNYIVKQFRNSTNSKHAQLVFTTHETYMMHPSHLRRDQIWLTERDADTLESTLFPMTDFHPRKNENFAKGYLEGRYGAVPFIDESVEGYGNA